MGRLLPRPAMCSVAHFAAMKNSSTALAPCSAVNNNRLMPAGESVSKAMSPAHASWETRFCSSVIPSPVLWSARRTTSRMKFEYNGTQRTVLLRRTEAGAHSLVKGKDDVFRFSRKSVAIKRVHDR